MENCGGEDGSRLESPHGAVTTPDHSNLSPPASLVVDHHHHHHVAHLATAKIIERAGIKENTLLPNGKIKHRSDENGLLNHHVLTTTGVSPDIGGLRSTAVVDDTSSEGAEPDKYGHCPTPKASSSSTKNVTNNQSSSTTSNSGGDTHDEDEEGDRPLSVSMPVQQSRTYQSHGDQVDCISQQIDTLNISSTTKDNNTSDTTSNSGGDTYEKDEEDGNKGDDDRPLSMSTIQQCRTYQSPGDQVDYCISQQIDTLNISTSTTTKDNNTSTDTTTNISTGVPCCVGVGGIGIFEDHHNCVKADNSDGTAAVPSSSSSSSPPARVDGTGTTVVAVNNNENENDDNNNNNGEEGLLEYRVYECELQMADIMRLITRDLSEPYSIYTYRYFIHNWPKLCFLCMDGSKCVGAIVCKLDIHKRVIRRGYIAMLAVDAEYRRRKIGSNLVLKAIRAMLADGCDEVVLETEITNKAALKLYENLGFVRDKRLFRYYLNGVDALRLKLWLR